MAELAQNIVQVVGVVMSLSGIMLTVRVAVSGYRDSKRAEGSD